MRRSSHAELARRELPGGSWSREPRGSSWSGVARGARRRDRARRTHPGEWPLKPGYVLAGGTARLLSGELRPLEDHDRLRWLARHELDSVDWLDQDRPAAAEAA